MFELGCIDDLDDRIKRDKNGREYRLERVYYSDNYGGSSQMERIYIDEE